MTKIKLVIFDCDGVIADSEAISADVLLDQLAELGLVLTTTDVRRNFLGRSFATVAQIIRDYHSLPLPDDFESEYRRRLLVRFETELKPTPGFIETFRNLKHPSCVATSSSPPRVKKSLQLLGIDEDFGTNVFTSSQVSRGKPAPDLFLFAAEKMGVLPSEVLVIEDSLPGIAAAKQAKMHVLGFRGGAHLQNVPNFNPPDIRSFDNWAEFPQLLKAIESTGEGR